jgi:prophage antirepressor-like protein
MLYTVEDIKGMIVSLRGDINTMKIESATKISERLLKQINEVYETLKNKSYTIIKCQNSELLIIKLNDILWSIGFQFCDLFDYKDSKSMIRDMISKQNKLNSSFIIEKMGMSETPFVNYLKSIDKYNWSRFTFISEKGWNEFLIRSQKKHPLIENFKYWITHKVIPNICHDNSYETEINKNI